MRPGYIPVADVPDLGVIAASSNGLFTISADGSTITPMGCAGHIKFADGATLDTIPKGFGQSDTSRMLHEIFGLDYRAGEGEDMFEFLVMLFVRDVRELLRRGLKFAYSLVQANEHSFKGRMLFAEHLRENLVHKERVYVEYELFSSDRAENRLIKSTLELLLKRSTSSRSRRDIKVLLTELEEIPSSTDVLRDLSRVNIDRNMMDYISAVAWCGVFLKALGIAGSSKGGRAFAVLADAEQVFEAYVARASSYGREGGSFSARCDVSMTTEGDVSVILADISWFYYDRRTKEQSRDAVLLYETAPGYRPIPRPTDGMSRAGRMAMGLLEGRLSYFEAGEPAVHTWKPFGDKSEGKEQGGVEMGIKEKRRGSSANLCAALLVVAVLMVAGFVTLTAEMEPVEADDSGYIERDSEITGEWSYDSNSHTLTIKHTGGSTLLPAGSVTDSVLTIAWSSCIPTVQNVIIIGYTNLPAYAFYGASNLVNLVRVETEDDIGGISYNGVDLTGITSYGGSSLRGPDFRPPV
ncbi:MAG: hypothetical protein Q4Q58_06245 [Thermoplasmata archaeon]|nr:hypothetical protein [Thermoplasmata archaeon]